jgi:hypothetical protein
MVQKATNPLATRWVDCIKPKVHETIERALDYRRDPIGAANVGLKILYGTGELSSTGKVEVSGNVAITFAWQAVQEPEHEIIDVTPQAQLTDSTHDK